MMLIKLLLVALILALSIAAIECVLLVALIRQLPRWRWRLLCLRCHAWHVHLSYRMRLMRERMQCHMHPSRACQDTREQNEWTWAQIEDAIRVALATDITVFCQAVQEVAA